MEECRFNNFVKALEPWLDRDYIRKVLIGYGDQVVLVFTDGGQKAFRIDDCTTDQMDDILADIRRRGIPVVGPE